MKKRETKYTLLTNISFIQRDNLRVNCHALLISEGNGDSFLSEGCTIRAFGTEAAWDVLSIWLEKDKHFPVSITPADSIRSTVMLTSSDDIKPIFSGYVLKLADGTSFFMQSDDSSRPIDMHEQEGDILKVWKILERKVAEYWDRPRMPRLIYRPPIDFKMMMANEDAREALAEGDHD